MWACQWRELRPMAFGGKSKQQADSGTVQNGHPPEVDEGAGFEMGTGRSGGQDGAGTYEMVGMAPKEPA